jgi:hypothetical protein
VSRSRRNSNLNWIQNLFANYKKIWKEKIFSHLYSEWAETQLTLESAQLLLRLFFSVHGPAALTPAHLSSRPAPAKSPADQSIPHVTQSRRAIQLASLLSTRDTDGPARRPSRLASIGAVNPDPTHPLARDRSSYPQSVRLNPSFTIFFNSITIRRVWFKLEIELSSSPRLLWVDGVPPINRSPSRVD